MRMEQQPTVSALSSSFSLPALNASLSMKYTATALCPHTYTHHVRHPHAHITGMPTPHLLSYLCLTLISLAFRSSLYWALILFTCNFNRRAVSYLAQSFSPWKQNSHTLLSHITRLYKGVQGGAHLEPGRRVEHDVLDGSLDVLSPASQPGDLVEMKGLGGRMRSIY